MLIQIHVAIRRYQATMSENDAFFYKNNSCKQNGPQEKWKLFWI